MMFLNEYEIERAVEHNADHPVLSAASRTLANLAEWTNQNSDGWPYWSKPLHAAVRLMTMIGRNLDGMCPWGDDDALDAEYRKALVPIRAFRTRQGASFEIVDV